MNSTATLQQEPQWETTFAMLAERSHLQRLPEQSRQSLSAAFKQHKRERRFQFFKQLVGQLSFDSASTALPAGARSAASAEDRQLVFTTTLGDIAIDVSGDNAGCMLAGQLFLDIEDTSLLVQLVSQDVEVAQTVADEFGEFQFEGVPSGTYDVMIASADVDIELPQVTLSL